MIWAGFLIATSVILLVSALMIPNYALFAGVLLLLVMAWQIVPSIKYWKELAPKTYFRIENNCFVTGDTETENKVSLDTISHITIQKKKGNVISVILNIKRGNLYKIEGISNIKGLVKELETIVGSQNIRVASWFHR